MSTRFDIPGYRLLARTTAAAVAPFSREMAAQTRAAAATSSTSGKSVAKFNTAIPPVPAADRGALDNKQTKVKTGQEWQSSLKFIRHDQVNPSSTAYDPAQVRQKIHLTKLVQNFLRRARAKRNEESAAFQRANARFRAVQKAQKQQQARQAASDALSVKGTDGTRTFRSQNQGRKNFDDALALKPIQNTNGTLLNNTQKRLLRNAVLKSKNRVVTIQGKRSYDPKTGTYKVNPNVTVHVTNQGIKNLKGYNAAKKVGVGNVAKAATSGPLAQSAGKAALNAIRREENSAKASNFSREYIHPGYYAERAERASKHIGLVDIFAQLTGYLAQPIDYNDKLVRATSVAAMSSGTPYNIDRTPPMLSARGSNTPFIMRDLDARIDVLLDQFLLDVPERAIDAQSVLFEMLRTGLTTYIELLRSVTVEARAALRPIRGTYDEYMASVVATQNPRIRELEAQLQQIRAQLNGTNSNAKRQALLKSEAQLQQVIATMKMNGRGNTYRTFSTPNKNEASFKNKRRKTAAARVVGVYEPKKLLMGAKQLAELQRVQQRFPGRARAIGVRFLQTQVRQRRAAVMTASGNLKKWACPTTTTDKTFLASGRIACVDSRLHSAIAQEYSAARAALTGRGVGSKNATAKLRNGLQSAIKLAKAQQGNSKIDITKIDNPMGDVDDRQVPLRTVFGDRLVKRNIVLHSFLDTLSDALLTLNPKVKMNPTAARLRNAMKATYHPFHKRFEEAGGDWKANPDTFGRGDMKYTEPVVDDLAWSSKIGSFGTSGPQPYWLQLVRELYDAQRVINVQYKVKLDSIKQDGPHFREVEGPLFNKYVSKALQLIKQPLPGSRSSAMAVNLGVTAAGYIMRSPGRPSSLWIKSYHRLGRDWYVDDYDGSAKYQLPFGAYREDFYDPTLPASGPQKGLLDVYLNQVITHLTSTEVGCRYGHVLTGGVSKLPPYELFKLFERIRGKDGFYEVRENGKETVTSYGAESGVMQGRAGPDIAWELLNGAGMIYGTRSDAYFGAGRIGGAGLKTALMAGTKGVADGALFVPKTPDDWSRRSAYLFTNDIRMLSARETLNKSTNESEDARRTRMQKRRAYINEKAADIRSKHQTKTARQIRDEAVQEANKAGFGAPAKRVNNTAAMARFGNDAGQNTNLVGRVDQEVVVFPVAAGADSRLKTGLTIDGMKQEMRTAGSKPGKWYPPVDIARLRKRAADSPSPMYFTAHDMKYEFLKKHGFGLTSVAQKGNDQSSASIMEANRKKLIESVLIVDGEIHSMSEYPSRLPVRFAGNPTVLSSSGRQGSAHVSRRLPLVSNPIPGEDPSRQARVAATSMAELLFADAQSGYNGLKKRLKENLVLPLFDGRMVLRYFHFHDLLMRFMRRTNKTKLNTWESVLELMDNPDTGDMMDCIMFYILCYTGVPEDQAARKLQVMYAMRKTRQGREALMKTVQDLRLLGDNGLMSKTLFTRIAKHLLATQSEVQKGRLSAKDVQTEVAALRKNVNRTNLTRRAARFFGTYKNARRDFGMKDKMTTEQLLKQRYSGRLALGERVQSAKLAVADAGSGIFGRRGILRGANVTMGPAR